MTTQDPQLTTSQTVQNKPAPKVKLSNTGTAARGNTDSCEKGVYAFVSLVAGSRAYIGQVELEDGVVFDGWCVFNPTGKVTANRMMPGVLFHSHGVFVTSSKKVADKLRAPLKARRPMMYHEYNPEQDPEVTAYLKDPEGKCVIGERD